MQSINKETTVIENNKPDNVKTLHDIAIKAPIREIEKEKNKQRRCRRILHVYGIKKGYI